MILVGRMVSPYVRRTAVLLDLLGLEFEHQPLSAIGDQEKLRAISPVGRVPALRMDGTTLVDSTAIALTLLDRHDPDAALMPKHGEPFAEALQLLFLANGATEKFVAGYYERTRRPQDKVYQGWIDLCEAQAVSALDALEGRVAEPLMPGGAGLSYLDVAIATGLTFIASASETVFSMARHPRLSALRARCETHAAMASRPPA